MALPKKQLREWLQNVDTSDEASVESTMRKILDGSTASLDAIREKLDDAESKLAAFDKTASDKDAEIARLTAELSKVTAENETLKQSSGDAAKVQEAFDAYKAEVEAKGVETSKMAAVRKLLKESGVGRESFVDLLAKQVDLSTVEMDGDKIKDTAFLDTLKADYADCFATQQTGGVPNVTPPSGNGGKGGMTKAEINAIKDPMARLSAMRSNLDVYGIKESE